MTADQAIEYIREAVRKAFPPTSNIEFSGGQSGRRGVITHVRIDAWIGAERLRYDHADFCGCSKPTPSNPTATSTRSSQGRCMAFTTSFGSSPSRKPSAADRLTRLGRNSCSRAVPDGVVTALLLLTAGIGARLVDLPQAGLRLPAENGKGPTCRPSVGWRRRQQFRRDSRHLP
jgi:hypothetical protein